MKRFSLVLMLVAASTIVGSMQASAQNFEPLDCPCASMEFLEFVENTTCNAGYDEIATKEKFYYFKYFISFGWGVADLWGEIARGEDQNPKARRCILGIAGETISNSALSAHEYVACKKYFEDLSVTLKSLESCG